MRPLGQSGIDASVVAFGAWVTGGWMWGGASEDDSIRAVHAALDAGINFIDTAPIYGFGLSEEIVGKAIRDRRSDVVLATKCGMVTNTTCGEPKFRSNAQGPDDDGHIGIYIYLHPDSIREEVEASLRRLGTDYIDLYQTHWQEDTTPIEDTMSTLLDLKQEGKIRAIGVSNATSHHMQRYRALGPLDADQEPFSMIKRTIEDDQLPYCRDNDIAVLAYSPLAQGLLTGKVRPEREFDEGDMRRNDPKFSVENRRHVQAMLDAFKPIAQAHDITLAQLTIAWTVHQPGLTHALCGARTPEQARENAAAGDVELSGDELKTMSDAIDAYLAARA
jgi:aryl-alcohol dehydrogenase-like predicted oxidoreductase